MIFPVDKWLYCLNCQNAEQIHSLKMQNHNHVLFPQTCIYYSKFAKDHFFYSVLLLCICNKYGN